MATLDAPIVVVGTFRSASTLVAELLGSREDHHYLGFELSEQLSEATGVPFAAPGSGDPTCPGLDAQDATAEQARRLRERLERQADQEAAPEHARLLIKNPHLWHRLGWVRALLPDARIVATVRDLRPTVASLKVLWRRSLRDEQRLHHLPEQADRCWDYVRPGDAPRYAPGRTFPGGDVRVLAEFWLRANQRLARAAERDEIVATVHHERTLTDPEAAMRRLQRRLGLDPVELEPPEPIDPSRQDEWRDRLTPEERVGLEDFVAEHQDGIAAVVGRLARLG